MKMRLVRPTETPASFRREACWAWKWNGWIQSSRPRSWISTSLDLRWWAPGHPKCQDLLAHCLSLAVSLLVRISHQIMQRASLVEEAARRHQHVAVYAAPCHQEQARPSGSHRLIPWSR